MQAVRLLELLEVVGGKYSSAVRLLIKAGVTMVALAELKRRFVLNAWGSPSFMNGALLANHHAQRGTSYLCAMSSCQKLERAYDDL